MCVLDGVGVGVFSVKVGGGGGYLDVKVGGRREGVSN